MALLAAALYGAGAVAVAVFAVGEVFGVVAGIQGSGLEVHPTVIAVAAVKKCLMFGEDSEFGFVLEAKTAALVAAVMPVVNVVIGL